MEMFEKREENAATETVAIAIDFSTETLMKDG